MSPDERTLIFSLIFSVLLILCGAWWYSKKYSTTLRATLLMLWQECFIDGLKENLTKVIPAIKTCTGAILGYIKKKLPKIFEFFHPDPEPVKSKLLNRELEYYLKNAVSDYASESFQIVIDGDYYPIPSYVYASLYTKSAITEDVAAEIVWTLMAIFKEYMGAYRLNFPCFPVPYVQNNHIEVYIYYCEFETERQAYQSKIDQIMQMRSTHRPVNEADTYDRDF